MIRQSEQVLASSSSLHTPADNTQPFAWIFDLCFGTFIPVPSDRSLLFTGLAFRSVVPNIPTKAIGRHGTPLRSWMHLKCTPFSFLISLLYHERSQYWLHLHLPLADINKGFTVIFLFAFYHLCCAHLSQLYF